MSSATPAAFLSAMSITTTSASCLSATPRATVAPTLPAPPTTVTLRFIKHPYRFFYAIWSHRLHIRDDGVAEPGRAQLGRAFHEAGEIVGHPFCGNRPVHPLDDQIGRFDPAEMAQHHLARQHHRSGID